MRKRRRKVADSLAEWRKERLERPQLLVEAVRLPLSALHVLLAAGASTGLDMPLGSRVQPDPCRGTAPPRQEAGRGQRPGDANVEGAIRIALGLAAFA